MSLASIMRLRLGRVYSQCIFKIKSQEHLYGDFHQNGVISTLHNLSNRSLDEIEKELREYSKDAPIELILPSLYSELDGEALKNIVSCLSDVKYLNHITIGLDKADKSEFIKAKKFFASLNQSHSILWNDSPKMKKLDSDLKNRNCSKPIR